MSRLSLRSVVVVTIVLSGSIASSVAHAYEVLDASEASCITGSCNNKLKCNVSGATCVGSCANYNDPGGIYESRRCTVRRPGDGTQDPSWQKCSTKTYTTTDHCVNNKRCACCRWAFYPGPDCGGNPNWGTYGYTAANAGCACSTEG